MLTFKGLVSGSGRRLAAVGLFLVLGVGLFAAAASVGGCTDPGKIQAQVDQAAPKVDELVAQSARLEEMLALIDRGEVPPPMLLDTIRSLLPEAWRQPFEEAVAKGLDAARALREVNAAAKETAVKAGAALAELRAKLEAAKASNNKTWDTTLAVVQAGVDLTSALVGGGVISAVAAPILLWLRKRTVAKATTAGRVAGALGVIESIDTGRRMDGNLNAAFANLDGQAQVEMHKELDAHGVLGVVRDSTLGPSAKPGVVAS